VVEDLIERVGLDVLWVISTADFTAFVFSLDGGCHGNESELGELHIILKNIFIVNYIIICPLYGVGMN
jgi:hypothetical protein